MIPRAFAAFWLMINSYLVGSSTGRSPALVSDFSLTSEAKRVAFGMISCRISRRLPSVSVVCCVTPVTLPPGRARLAITPPPTGFCVLSMTMGMAAVALFAPGRPAVLVSDVAPFDISQFAQLLQKGVDRFVRAGDGTEVTNAPDLPLRLRKDGARCCG